MTISGHTVSSEISLEFLPNFNQLTCHHLHTNMKCSMFFANKNSKSSHTVTGVFVYTAVDKMETKRLSYLLFLLLVFQFRISENCYHIVLCFEEEIFPVGFHL